MQFKSQIMDNITFSRMITRISHEILERNKGADGIVLLGIRRRGVPIARKIQSNLSRIEGANVPRAELDMPASPLSNRVRCQ